MMVKLVVLFVGLGILEAILMIILSTVSEWLAYLGLLNESVGKISPICYTVAVLSFLVAGLFGIICLVTFCISTSTMNRDEPDRR